MITFDSNIPHQAKFQQFCEDGTCVRTETFKDPFFNGVEMVDPRAVAPGVDSKPVGPDGQPTDKAGANPDNKADGKPGD